MTGVLESRVRIDPRAIQRNIPLKGDLPFALDCPGLHLGRNCSKFFYQWLCMACLEPLKYWYEGVVGCKNCGVFLIEACKFKCSDPNHGPDIVQFDASKQPLSRS